MGIYTRKSISVGPFRFNLSQSGLGVSAGIKGLRIGTGPRGNYVRIGARSIYYRSTIPSGSSDRIPTKNIEPIYEDYDQAPTHEPLNEIESAHVTQIVDSSSAELLKELNDKKKRARTWPFIFVAFLSLTYLFNYIQFPEWVVISTLVLGLIFTWLSHIRDMLTKTTVLFYDFDSEMESIYDKLFQAAERLEKCSKSWHVSAAGKVIDKKYHAGASNLVDRKPTIIRITDPPYLKTNVRTVSLAVGRQTLHFFPDRVLVYDAAGVGAVSYQKLVVTIRDKRFIEDETVPSDALIIDRTWKYVNKSGGPDRRFKDNHELPICLYQEISFTSSTGLNELIQLSSCGPAEDFKIALTALTTSLPKEA
ncbi:DUF4236 domain-containing protein [Aeromonas sp. sif2416]|uniref:DUF4236 domain-containing protein n=1 Tax=Aeromonas sp. sif2416 TaxID=2854793 RepID=UPI001C45EAE6|nr:DUF4236 domain-containing protein [Aeromonas sp. sif2416]MBV7438971.1 DUF4236 domain-containing protein [Aeromonas sp. sif2416]